MTSDQLERKAELALQLGTQNHDAITDIRGSIQDVAATRLLNEQSELQRSAITDIRGGIQDVMAATRLLNEQSELQRRAINELGRVHTKQTIKG